MEVSNNVTTQPRAVVSLDVFLASHPDLYKLSLEEAEETYQTYLLGEDSTGTGMLNPDADLLPAPVDQQPPNPGVSPVREVPELDFRSHCLHLQSVLQGHPGSSRINDSER